MDDAARMEHGATWAAKLRKLGFVGSARKTLRILREEGLAGVAGRLHSQPLRSDPLVKGMPAEAGKSGGINLVGHPFGALGMGEHVRKSAHAFAAAGVPFVLVNTFNQDGPHRDKFQEFPFQPDTARSNPYPVSLFHLNADEMALASAHLGAGFFEHRYNIGYPAWELSKFPDAWLPALDFFDEIWAPSRFIQQAIADKFAGPVLHMPLAVEFVAADALPRRHFGLPEDKFLFLFYFDFTSYVARKNPYGALEAFRRAFNGTRRDVALVIKLNGGAQRPEDYRRFFDALGRRDESIILIDRVLSDLEVRSLVCDSDCFVSLHRSEGFGRGIAEAMYYGRPVIATGYSGNTDYLHADNGCVVDYTLVPVKPGEYPHCEGQVWADPDIDQAAYYMRTLVDQPSRAQALAAQAAKFIRDHHSFAAVGGRYRRRLERLVQTRLP